MTDICSRRKVDPTLVESDSIKWVLLLLHLIDFTSDKAETYLKLFVFSRSKVLKSQKCRQEIKKYVSKRDREKGKERGENKGKEEWERGKERQIDKFTHRERERERERESERERERELEAFIGFCV